MHRIDFYLELHWAKQRPALEFAVNGHVLEQNVQILSSDQYEEKAVIKTQISDLESINLINIRFYGKNDQLVTEQSDHWVDIKNIAIDDVFADAMLINSAFQHQMPEHWVAEMLTQGHRIDSVYQPGTTMRLNGCFSWQFNHPFIQHKLLDLWSLD